MKSVPVFMAALVPLALAAQQAELNIDCLSAAQQAELTAKARAISADVAQRRPAVEAALQGGFTVGDATARQATVNLQLRECSGEARKAGRSALEACEHHFIEMRMLSDLINELVRNPKMPVDLLGREERLRLASLRARYPQCGGTTTAQR